MTTTVIDLNTALNMSRQDKATTDRNARILRDLVKQPDNKSCADCRKNDARWASWNLGVYLCIRCSGIHRAMGTHISKVKSIDLDIWTPEQMDTIQKWGNRRANAYWERHLKVGHVPPEHKIESFIRSKYESKRWAMEGPPPRDPSVLDDVANARSEGVNPPAPGAKPTSPPPVNTASRPTPTSTAPAPAPRSAPHPLLSRQTQQKALPPKASAAPIIDFFGEDTTTAAPQTAPQAQSAAPTQAQVAQPQPQTVTQNSSNIFDLDFKAPTPPAKQTSAKADIMSLFSQPSATAASGGGGFFNATSPQQQYASWNGGGTATAPPQQQQTSSAVPTFGFGDQGVWGQPQPQQSQQQQQGMDMGMGGMGNQQGGFGVAQNAGASPWGSDPWAQPAQAQPPAQPKKEERDPFANIWG